MPTELERPYPSTFSIVAWDGDAREWGVAVQSKFLGVGSVVPWAQAGVGAIATQARANTRYGPLGLELLRSGKTAREVVEELISTDEGADSRQLGVVDSHGRAWAFTGSSCLHWAGHQVGEGFSCQGNILAGPHVVAEMARAFRESSGDLAERLLQSLLAGQAAGGDRRGKQSAAILVVREKGGYGQLNDRYIDLRVEDHPDPITELVRLVDTHRIYFFSLHAGKTYPFRGPIIDKLRDAFVRLGKVEETACADRVYQEVLDWGRREGIPEPREGWVNHDVVLSIFKALQDRQ
ncbi:MAG TPA: DUF1028 domain-containing protein [Firmicutes bacterium]|nr:DUF1028 domain-containing protein [Candidatus Fermentithermobacillaceae bacterium]